eukprot:6193536-Pleurochrysis_carterae.AAC.1
MYAITLMPTASIAVSNSSKTSRSGNDSSGTSPDSNVVRSYPTPHLESHMHLGVEPRLRFVRSGCGARYRSPKAPLERPTITHETGRSLTLLAKSTGSYQVMP